MAKEHDQKPYSWHQNLARLQVGKEAAWHAKAMDHDSAVSHTAPHLHGASSLAGDKRRASDKNKVRETRGCHHVARVPAFFFQEQRRAALLAFARWRDVQASAEQQFSQP